MVIIDLLLKLYCIILNKNTKFVYQIVMPYDLFIRIFPFLSHVLLQINRVLLLLIIADFIPHF
jgi:hypothetical protein